MSYIKGKFKHIIFESESGYRVGLFKVNETDDENIPTNKLITYTGYFMKTNDNDNYVLNGKYIFHDRYGYQFSTDNYEKIVPEGKDAILDFLTSSFVKGCGEVTAKKIYKVFGNDSLYKIKENKSNLELVEGINEKKREQIYNSVCKYFDNDALIVELKNMGFSVKETMNLINKFGKKIKDIINKNIYDLSDEINFKKLDEIFLSNNDMEDDRRVKACLIETMKYLTFSTGDIYLYKEYLIKLYNYKVDINNKKKILEKLNTINIEGCVIPEYALFNGKDLIGVQMEYLYDYDALYDLLSIKNIDYNIRKNIAIKICQIILEIEKNDAIYYDIHEDNFLIRNQNVKTIDMDSILLRSRFDNEEYEINRLEARRRLIYLCMQLLLNTIDFNITNIKDSRAKSIYALSSKKQKELYDFAFLDMNNEINPLDYLDYFNEDYTEGMKKILCLR